MINTIIRQTKYETPDSTHLYHVDIGIGSCHESRADQDEISELGGERRRDEDFEDGDDALEELGVDGGFVLAPRRTALAIFCQKKAFRTNLSPLKENDK